MFIAFVGDNGHSREQAAKEFIINFVDLHGAVAVDRLAGEDINIAALSEAISTSPFLSLRRLVVVRDFGANKELTDNLDKITTLLADTTDLAIIETSLDSRGKFLNELKKHAEVREFTHLQGDELVNWVGEQATKLGGNIDRRTAMALIDRVGVNHQLLASEITKLILLSPQITIETIKQLTVRSPQSSVFAMLDAAFAGNQSKALQLYAEQRAVGMEPKAILGMIVWQLHILNIVKAAGSMPADQIASEAKISPYVVRKNISFAKNISHKKLIDILNLTIETDRLLKRSSANEDDALQALIIAF